MCSRDPVEAALAGLAGTDPRALDDTTLQASVVQLRRQCEAMTAQWLRHLGELDRRQVPAQQATTTTGWVRAQLRLSHSAAAGQVRLARALPGLPNTAAALQAGDIWIQHAQSIAIA